MKLPPIDSKKLLRKALQKSGVRPEQETMFTNAEMRTIQYAIDPYKVMLQNWRGKEFTEKDKEKVLEAERQSADLDLFRRSKDLDLIARKWAQAPDNESNYTENLTKICKDLKINTAGLTTAMKRYALNKVFCDYLIGQPD